MVNHKIILGCIQGDGKSTQELYEAYLPYCIGILKRFGIPKQEWKDIIQDIFVAVLTSLKKYDEKKGSFKGWFKAVSINIILKRNRKHTSTQKKILRLDDHPNWNLVERAQDPHNEQYLMDLISELPNGYRVVFNLHAIDGYSHKQIAEFLGIKESSSRSRLARARKILQAKLNVTSKKQVYGK